VDVYLKRKIKMDQKFINILEYGIPTKFKGKFLYHDWIKTLPKGDIEIFLPSQKND
jgi:hypothetical protein